MPAETLARHQLSMQVRQSIKWDTRIPVMLDVVADIARQDEEQLDQGGDGGAGNPILFIIALYCTVLANDACILNHNMPGAIGDDPKEQEGVPSAKDSQNPGNT